MTDETRVPTEQENTIYEALMAGDTETVEELRSTAAQFPTDFSNAHMRYQAEHEIPEEDRMSNTAEQVERENADAPSAETPEEPEQPQVDPAPADEPEAPQEPAEEPSEEPDEGEDDEAG
jgi:hypothetical protein